MSDENQSLNQSDDNLMPLEHDRVLWIMGLVGVLGSIVGGAAFSLSSGFGFLLGTALAFGSYFWLKHSLGKIFADAVSGERPRVSAIRYLARYFTIGAAVAVIYATNAVPIISVILGMAGFGFAITIDGILRIFTGTSNNKEL